MNSKPLLSWRDVNLPTSSSATSSFAAHLVRCLFSAFTRQLIGTGKTTVARVIGNILFDLGLLSVRGRLVVTSGTELVGDYVGQTKTKVNLKMKEANGGVLFIDEAYMLAKQRGGFADEAIGTLLEGMTSDELRGLVVIIAGYRDHIDHFLTLNPGLPSRFTHLVEFKDWTAEDCCLFFEEKAEV